MAHIEPVRIGKTPFWDSTLCLTMEECEQLLPDLEAALKKSEKRYEKYKDIHEGGEATTRQQDLLIDAESKMKTLTAVVNTIYELLKIQKE